MKKIIIMALTITGIAFGAEAQGQTQEVCSVSKNKQASCYHTKYAENFPICKSYAGYYVCGERPTKANSTIKANAVASLDYSQNMYEPASGSMPGSSNSVADAMTVPQSQSYPTINMINAGAYEGYYPKKHYIRVSYDNVADDNLAPYEGLPSPQYDGPEKNAERNINASNPNAHLAPLTGRSE